MREPGRISSYFIKEKWILAIVAVTGILYNVGMIAGPWLEGKLAQYLYDIISDDREYSDILVLAAIYVLVILTVQGMRFLKRFYVRRFANNVNSNMKMALYEGLVNLSVTEMKQQSSGSLMTKAAADVDACSEGMRKFTTEVFDTGIVMAAYLVMLLCYDWRLAAISCAFPPIAYIIAEKLKKHVVRSNEEYKKSAGRLNDATLDRVNSALLYRITGQEDSRNAAYDSHLNDYEKRAVKADLWSNTLQPVFQIISMTGVIFILWFGSRNVLGTGWCAWDIAAFTTFLSCFAKLAVKSSKAAKLFNAVQKAEVSWGRIKPLMGKSKSGHSDILNLSETADSVFLQSLHINTLSFSYPDCDDILCNISFDLAPGEIIGVTGEVASGKSTLGRVFLCEYPYKGSILYNGEELGALPDSERGKLINYMGHQPELFSDTIMNNILLGARPEAYRESSSVEDYEDYVLKLLQAVCLDEEVSDMADGILTQIGNGGIRLSGGQQQRIALARSLCHMSPLMILDDPFSAVDYNIEQQIFRNLAAMVRERKCAVILISHRLSLFPGLDKVLWLDKGCGICGTHEQLIRSIPAYRKLYELQNNQGNKEKG